LSSEEGLLFYLKEQPKWPFTFSIGDYAAAIFTKLISFLIIILSRLPRIIY
jgi:hypothetical protein